MAAAAGLQTKIGDFANIFKAFIGTNYLSLPFGFYISGIGFGIVGLLIVAVFTDYSCLLMVRCKYLLIDSLCHDYAEDNAESPKAKLEQKISSLRSRLMLYLDYGDLVNLTFGKRGLYFVNFCIVVTQAGFCMNYFIVIGNLLETLIPISVVNVTIPWILSNSSLLLDNSSTIDLIEENVNAFKLLDEETELLLNDTSTAQPEILDTIFISERSPMLLPLLVLAPLPILILFTYFRTVRQLSIVSIFANTCACLGFLGCLFYLVVDFELADDISAWVPSGFLVYIGQATGAFEAVALILPIEASMIGNWQLFPMFLHGAMTLMTVIILIMAILGYLSFGSDTQQIILQNLSSGEPLTIFINLLVITAVICTYPMQIVPVIQILENTLFGEKDPPPIETIVPDIPSPTVTKETTPLMTPNVTPTMEDRSLDSLQLSAAYHVPKSVETWKRNLCRTLVTVAICGLAIALRNVLAYSSALIGALGSCPLAYIIPCVLYNKLHTQEIKRHEIIWNYVIIAFGSVCSVAGVILSLHNIVKNV